MRRYDVVVLGLGAMGSAAAYHLAGRGLAVLGLDRFRPPHTMGSTHGESRIIRQAYWEDPSYVPLLKRAFALWRDLEDGSGSTLLRETGILLMGVPDGEVVPGALDSAAKHGLDVEPLTRDEVRRRWPHFRPDDAMEAVLETKAGGLFPERCVDAHLRLAREAGARLRFDEPASSWRAGGDGVVVETGQGSYAADRLVVAAGAWSSKLLHEAGVALEVERQVQYWLAPAEDSNRFRPDACPIFAFEPSEGELLYGFPDFGSGVKAAVHHEGTTVDPDRVDRDAVLADETAAFRKRLGRFAPALDVAPDKTAVCLYTNTPDRHFIIDRHPEHENVVVAAGFSGHGFKFSAVVGEAIADLVADEEPQNDLRLFRFDRF